MAVIPDVADIRQINPTGQAAVTRTPGLDQIDPGVATGVGKQFEQNMQEMYERQTKTQLAKARTQLQLAKIEQDNAYEDDDELETIEERWHGSMMEHLGKASTNIMDSQVRDLFVQEGRVTVEGGAMAMRGKVQTRIADREMGSAENATAEIIKGAISETGDIGGGFRAIESTWESMADNRYVSNEEAQQKIRDSKYAIAEGKIESLAPQDQLEALQSDWAKELPQDIRVALERAAKEELRLGKAQIAAIESLKAGKSETEATLDFYDQFKDDPQAVLDAMRMYSSMTAAAKRDEAEVATDNYEMYADDIRAGNIRVDDIVINQPERWKTMSEAMKQNLVRLEDNMANKPPTYSDRFVLNELIQLYSNEQIAEAKMFFYENSAKLNATDYKDWSNKVHLGAASSLFDFQKQVEDITVGMGTKRKAGIYNAITRWYLRYQEENDGAQPSDREVQERLDRAVTNYSTGFFTSDLPSEMDIDDAFNAYRRMEPRRREEFLLDNFETSQQFEIVTRHYRREYPESYKSVIEFYQRQGVPPDQIDRHDLRNLINIDRQKRGLRPIP